MKTAELRDLDVEALGKKRSESREELFKLRFQHATAQLEKTHRLREVRKDIARIMTVQNAKKRQG